MPSRLFVYYTTRMLMGTLSYDSGVDNRSMLKALAQYGWCDESMWPYNIAKYKHNPPPECFRQAETRKIQSYLAVRQTLEDMKACIAGGDPFIFGFSVYQSIDEAEATGIIPYPKRNERSVGGHDVILVGYDDATQMFKLRNSWGNWGQQGYGWISYKYATNPNLATDFWTVRHSALPDVIPPLPPQPPTPPQPPVPPITSKGKIVVEIDWTRHTVDGVSVE
jgi:C1A family cysteine protease